MYKPRLRVNFTGQPSSVIDEAQLQASSQIEVNNISIKPQSGVFPLVSRYSDTNPLMVFGNDEHNASEIGVNDFWVNEEYRYNGIIGGLTDDQGLPIDEYILRIRGKSGGMISHVTLNFDPGQEQWATKAQVRRTEDSDWGSELENAHPDPTIWTFQFDETREVSIRLNEWVRPNFNMLLTFVEFDLAGKIFDKKWLNKIAATKQIKPFQAEPFYGILQGTGNISLNDVGGVLKYYSEEDILQPNGFAEVELNGRSIIKMIVEQWKDYVLVSKTLDAKLTDDILFLENKSREMALTRDVSMYEVFRHVMLGSFFRDEPGKSALDLFTEALQDLIFIGTDNSGISTVTIENYLKAITVKYAFLVVDTFKITMQKLLNLTQLSLNIGENGRFRFSSARPRVTQAQKTDAAIVKARAQLNDWQETLNPKNRWGVFEIESSSMDVDITDVEREAFPLAAAATTTWGQGLRGPGGGRSSYYVDGVKRSTTGNWYKGRINWTIQWARWTKTVTINAYTLDQIKFIVENHIQLSWMNFGSTITKERLTAVEVTNLNQVVNITSPFLPTYPEFKWQRNTNWLGIETSVDVFVRHPEFKSYVQNVVNKVFYKYYNVTQTSLGVFSVTYEVAKPIGVTGLILLERESDLATVGTEPVLDSATMVSSSEYALQAVTSRITEQVNNYIYSTSTQNLTMEGSELMQSDTLFKGQRIFEYIRECINEDYNTKEGIRQATVTLLGSVNYSTEGELQITNWDDAESGKSPILKTGSICRFKNSVGKDISVYRDGTPRYWKITGINVSMTTAFRIEVELMEVW